MPATPKPRHDPSLVPGPGADDPTSSRRRLVVAAVVIGLLAVVVGVVVVQRRGGGGAGAGSASTSEVTFGPERDATTIEAPPPGGQPLIALSVDTGAAGAEVVLQGAGFKAGKGFRAAEVFWDQAGGLKLTSVDGPRFAVPIKIPADAPVLKDGHNIVVVQRNAGGKVVSQLSVPFFVLPPRR